MTDFLVIGDTKTGKPVTADYDLFSIIFPMSDLEHYINVREMPSWETWKASVNYDELSAKEKNYLIIKRNMIVMRGRITVLAIRK
ncbi:hypothetical protein AB6H32_09850 [Providencia hangzhouensis]